MVYVINNYLWINFAHSVCYFASFLESFPSISRLAGKGYVYVVRIPQAIDRSCISEDYNGFYIQTVSNVHQKTVGPNEQLALRQKCS